MEVKQESHKLYSSLSLPLPLSAQRDLPGHRSLQDVPSHGHLETRLRLPGQHQVRALRSPRYPLKLARNSAPYDILLGMEMMFHLECDGLASTKRTLATEVCSVGLRLS